MALREDEYGCLATSERKCRVCGCTDDDCRGCIERTGTPCYWADLDLCSACVTPPAKASWEICIHCSDGLCADCQAAYDEDPSAWVEYGDHQQGIANWRALEAEIAASAAESLRAAHDGPAPSADDLPF